MLGISLISFLNYLTKKIDLVQNIAIGDPVAIIKNKKFILDNIKKNKIDMLSISSALHAKGIQSFDKIVYAQIEPNGQLTLIMDSNEMPSKILVNEGSVKSSILNEIEKDEDWLQEVIEKFNLKLEEVFLMEYSDHDVLIVDNDGITHRKHL